MVIAQNRHITKYSCTGYVNENLKKVNPRIQIWTLENIITLLNAHLGSDWYSRLHLLIANQRNK